MVKARSPSLVEGVRLLLQARKLTLDVVHQQVRDVVAEATLDHDTERSEVGRFFGNV